MYRTFAACWTTWSMPMVMKSENCSSTTGRMPGDRGAHAGSDVAVLRHRYIDDPLRPEPGGDPLGLAEGGTIRVSQNESHEKHLLVPLHFLQLGFGNCFRV